MPDLLCFDDIDEFGREIYDPLAELEQDVVHMLFETPGSNIDALDRSIDLASALSGSDIPGLANRIEAKLESDERIRTASVKIANIGGRAYSIRILLELDEDELGITIEYDGNGNVKRVS